MQNVGKARVTTRHAENTYILTHVILGAHAGDGMPGDDGGDDGLFFAKRQFCDQTYVIAATLGLTHIGTT